MTVASFDTLKFANTLKAAGVPEKQAEAQSAILAEALAVNFKELATKDDLALLRIELKGDLRELNSDLRETEQRFKSDLRETEQRLNAKIDGLTVKVDGQMTLLKWMIGLSTSLSVAILIRLFFVRIP